MPKACILEIKVADMDVAWDFYCNKLGFGVQTEAYLPETLALEHDGADLILFKATKNAEIDYPHSAMSLIIFQVEDIISTAEEYKSQGIQLVEGPDEVPPGTFMAFRYPFDNVLGLMQLRSES
ncbi:MAG: hypothetical protein FVQ83_11780 [Chloroflexi bacterium]|nr:hypothetical protein [Chloroflexota bacterium]